MFEKILYQFSDDDSAMFGGDPDNLTGVDTAASLCKFKMAVAVALDKNYHDAEIAVRTGPDRIEVDGMCDAAECETVAQIVHEIWESWNWVVNIS